jgi:hypothetical protein
VARIRSIKPEFFTSEVIAALTLSARLTFIGLWTYVDDNGVGLDNERLILAAIWPLEDDVVRAVQMTREDLRSLSRAGLVARYRLPPRQFIHITGWEEHQKVSHPRKPRYPLPTDPGVTCVNIGPLEPLGRHSGGLPEPLRPEQGAGIRDQGSIQHAPRAAADEPRHDDSDAAELTINQRAKAITDAYYDKEPMCKWPAVNAIVIRAIKDGRWDDSQIQDALLRMAGENRSVTVDSLRIELNGLPPLRNSRQADTNELFDRAMARAEAREEIHDPARNGHPDPLRQSALPPASN